MSRCAPIVALAAALALPASAQNLLANDGFELPSITEGVETPGAQDWNAFGAVFTQTDAVAPVLAGDQSLKMFGGTSGVFQDFPASEGQLWNGGSFIINSSIDPMSGGQIAAVNIEWIDAGGNQIGFITNGADSTVLPIDEWTQRTITGTAPAGTATARFVLITGNFGGDPAGGAPFYDQAFFELVPEPASAALVLGGLTLIGSRRRRAR